MGLLPLTMLAAACTGVLGPLPPAAPAGSVPDFRGTWQGTWAGTPVTLIVLDQPATTGAEGGLVLGWVPVLGTRTPDLSGILTSTIRGDAVSSRALGWFGRLHHEAVLVVRSATADGDQELRLRVAGPERLVGSGQSAFSWGPHGAVELRRRPGG